MSQTNSFSFSYQDISNATSQIPLHPGSIIFVLGANGTGKSGLMTHLSAQNHGKVKRILAHRQTWFTSNALEFR